MSDVMRQIGVDKVVINIGVGEAGTLLAIQCNKFLILSRTTYNDPELS